MSELAILEVPVAGMDCAECTQHVRHAIAGLPGVVSVDVFLTSEKAIVRLDPAQVDLPAIRGAVEGAGYSVPEARPALSADASSAALTRQTRFLFAGIFAAVLFIVIGGEWLGLFETLTALIPLPIGAVIVLIAGFPVFRNVVRATLHKQIISHTLMTLGVIAALVVGQWVTALLVVFFMRVGDAVERFTTERARRAVKNLAALAPQTARIEQPGEQIPVDGEVVSGQATVDQAAITGEGLPVEAGPGSPVYAATYARLGHLHIRATHVGADTTFGKVIRLVEEAEAHRADVQRIADRFSTWFLPIVAVIAALTLIISRDPLATAAVLVVACSCSIALATPIAMLASIGAGAQRGLLIKGGRYLELLAQADVLLIDKTGTVTLGKPRVTDI
ncbi:MAG: HAD-IC family P-type ATPase, partial [Anaerolineae bacterium]|nr:HAD-IC family P-type ATPase [Anaerolineae bacterium]